MRTTYSLAALLLASTLLSSCQEEEPVVAAPRPVLSMLVSAEPLVQQSFTGTVEARVETQFGFRILGRIVARNVQTGDLVKQGDVLAAIDPLALELAVKSAQSDLANSEAQLANAMTNEERQKTLFERQSGAKASFETAELERKTAEAGVAKAKANLAKANEQLGYSRLVAEFDGVVTATSAEVGQVVSAGQSVATVARPEERDAVIDVPEAPADTLKPGLVFEVSLQLDPSVHAQAVVREIAPDADELTRTRRTKLTILAPPDVLRLGSVITATATAGAGETAPIQIPASAIKTDGAKHLVWIVDQAQQKVFARPVTLQENPAQEGNVIVTEGLKPGDRIAVAGANTFAEGQTIRVDQEMTP